MSNEQKKMVGRITCYKMFVESRDHSRIEPWHMDYDHILTLVTDAKQAQHMEYDTYYLATSDGAHSMEMSFEEVVPGSPEADRVMAAVKDNPHFDTPVSVILYPGEGINELAEKMRQDLDGTAVSVEIAPAETFSNEVRHKPVEGYSSKRLYVDMDGVLAVFNNQIESEEVLFQKGYYRNLPPQQNVVDAIKLLKEQSPDTEVYILSAVLPSGYAEQEKNEWLDEILPEIDPAHRIFVPCGEDKGDYIGHVLGDDDLLLDDYSKNLHSWCPPGRAIKLMNDINGNFGTWQGKRVSMHDSPQQIANTILNGFERERERQDGITSYVKEHQKLQMPTDDIER